MTECTFKRHIPAGPAAQILKISDRFEQRFFPENELRAKSQQFRLMYQSMFSHLDERHFFVLSSRPTSDVAAK